MDKLKHFGACFLIALLVGALSGPVAGVVLALIVGVGKELYDSNHGGKFDFRDLTADLSGALVGALIALALIAPSHAMEWPQVDQIAVDATFAPPHNEPVVYDLVARYRVRPVLEWHWWRIRSRSEVNLWGCNEWRTPDQVGHGIPDAWQGSDWSVDKWRWDARFEGSIEVAPHTDLFTEYRIDGTVGKHYYWLTGVRVRMY